MSRASGKHGPRTPVQQPAPGSPEGNYIGVPDAVLPGGQQHLANETTTTQKVAVPQRKPQFRGMMAHGVEAPAHHHDKATSPARPAPPKSAPPAKVVPVPVYLVEGDQGGRPLRVSSPRAVTLQASTGIPILICPRNANRVRVLLLNESTGSDIRFATSPADLATANEGALLPWPNNSYLSLETQDSLWAISADTGTPRISVIQEYETKRQ